MPALPRSSRVALTGSALAAGALGLLALPASAQTEVERPSTFTSAFTVNATPSQVVTPDGPKPGEPGSSGTFTFQLNSDEDVLCYDIVLRGVTPPYQSMARTSTHVHEAAAGKPGPPRIVFPDPQPDGDVRRSSGCMKGPFTTGLTGMDGQDTGTGFTVAELEDDPTGYYVDAHTATFVPGAVRGQFRAVPVGSVAAGLGGEAGDPVLAPWVALAAGALVLAAGGTAAVAVPAVARRRARG